ncbi:MAG: EAL domain-containing protein [Nitrosomonadales bacterium]|nr:EAL domain-containing protein [Nitrosomonadales bacterium]
MMKNRLSILIPLLLVIVSVFSAFLVFLESDSDSKRRIKQETLSEIGMEMSRLQNLLYNRLTMGNEADALLDISLAAMHPGVHTLMLTDGEGKVMLANRFSWRGEPAAAHSAYSNAEASLAVRSGVSKLAFSQQDPSLLQGYYPLVVSYQQGGLKKQMGLMYVESDIRGKLKEARQAALEQSLIFGGIILAAALLIAFILHRLVSRRVNVLLAAARRLAIGDYAVKTRMGGNDELSELGKAFDGMAESVSGNIALREQAALDQKRVLDTAIDGYWMVDSGARLLEVNEAYCRMTGYSREELLSMHISDLEAKEVTLEQVRGHIARIIEQGNDRFETVHRCKDGSLLDVEVAVTYWKDRDLFFVFIRDISERSYIQKALSASKGQYDRLAANIPIGVYLLHTTATGEFRFKYVSPRFCSILGVTAASIYTDAQAAFDPIHPDDLDGFVALNQEAVRTRQPFLWEGRIVRDGVVRWLRIESKPEMLENGDCIWDGMMQDITEQQQARLALDLEQARLAEAQKVGHFGSWELSLSSGELVWSDEIFKIFEIDKARFAASYEAFLNAIHPDDREKVNLAYTDSLVDRQPYQIVHRLQMPDGRIKWVEERCSSTFDAAGNPLRSIGTVQDVTERERLSEQARIAAVAFETQEAIIVTDRDANIIKVNRAFEEITGYSQEEVLGKNPRFLSSGRHDRAFYQQMWDVINEQGRWSGEMWDRRKDGGIYPKWLTITSVKYRGEVTHYVAVFVDITERKKAEEEIKNLAFFDPLTGLPNRRLLLDRLHLALGQSARSENFGALMFLDLDHFKVLNDTKGHEYGDKLLVEVARRLNTCVRETDTVARFGGDEFIVLLEGLSLDQNDAVGQAGRIAEKMRDALSQPYQLGEEQYQTSPSIGVVLFRGDLVTTEELLKQADLAMYKAKERGRNMVCFFEASMQALLESRTLLENALRQALPNGELELFYQLQTNEAKELLGAEVLLRWRSAVLGIVSPAEFIPMAEKTKLILPIGHWVLETACRQLKAWEKHPVLASKHLAVNISPVQFHQPDFVRRVMDVLDVSGADPRLLELELTENLVLEDVQEATRKMDALKAIGVRFSMDDFGTGYSSLQYIKRLPIDQLKIDQSFVRDILTDPGDAMMVQTIAGMAHNFGFDVIAEGVETQEQLAPLILRGCVSFQGYLFSKPLPLAAFEALVAQWPPQDKPK